MSNYFNDEDVLPHLYRWIEEEDTEIKSIIWEKHLHKPISKVIRGTIYANKGQNVIGYEKAFSDSLISVHSALNRFDPSKGKNGRALFNYISWITKRTCKWEQIKEYDKKKINNEYIVELNHINDPGYEEEYDSSDEELRRFTDWLKLYLPIYAVNFSPEGVKGLYDKLEMFSKLPAHEVQRIHSNRALHKIIKSHNQNQHHNATYIRRLIDYIKKSVPYYLNDEPYPIPDKYETILIIKEKDYIAKTFSSAAASLRLQKRSSVHDESTKKKILNIPLMEEKIINGYTVFRYK